MATLTRSLAKLRAGYDVRFPNRDRASDGWIGDRAHAQRVSGHNPDETGGGEYEDVDNVDEVRAIDVDKDLRGDMTMLATIQLILATPNDRKRLRYVIYNREIWSASRGWVRRPYDGDNDHDQHAHYSGDPAYDDDVTPWAIEKEIDLNTEQAGQLRDVHFTAAAGIPNPLPGGGRVPLHVWAAWLTGAVKALTGTVTALANAAGQSDTIEEMHAELDNLAESVSRFAAEEEARDVATAGALAELRQLLAALDAGTLTQDELVSRIRVQVEAVQPSETDSNAP